jgi:hypothetical protein
MGIRIEYTIFLMMRLKSFRPEVDKSWQSKKCCVCLHVVTIYGIDAVANEIDVVLKFFDSGMKTQDFN